MVRFAFLFILILLISSCRESSLSVSDPVTDELYVRMERGGCYGLCPIYSVEIESDGKVTFDGKFYTKTTGKAEARISPRQIEQIVKAIKGADFFSIDDAYGWDSGNCPSLATDMPNVILHIRLGDREKTVRHYLGCFQESDSGSDRPTKFGDEVFPQKLYLLENKIDELADTKKWQ